MQVLLRQANLTWIMHYKSHFQLNIIYLIMSNFMFKQRLNINDTVSSAFDILCNGHN